MRRFTLAALALATVFLAVGCEGPDTTNILEPSFGKVPRNCELSDAQEGVIGLIDDGIDLLFDERNAKKAAKGHIDNILREVCDEDYPAARQHLHSFIQQVEGQPEEKLTVYREEWANLVNWAIILATDPGSISFEIPAGAFEPTGNLGILDPTTFSLSTAIGDAAVLPDPEASFDPFIMAISRIPDGDVGNSAEWNRPSAPPGYQILADGDLGDSEALVAVCLYPSFLSYMDLPDDIDEDELDDILGRLILAHAGDTGVLLLEPTEDLPAGFGCPPDPTEYPGPETLAAAPGWIQSIGRLAGTLARKAFGPEPLHARRFAGRGLTGRTGSFSPFAPVDPYDLSLTSPDPWPGPSPNLIFVGDPVQLGATLTVAQPGNPPPEPVISPCDACTWESDNTAVATVGNDGLVSPLVPGTAVITVRYPGLRQSVSVTVIPKSGDLIVDLNIEEVSAGVSIPENGWTVELYGEDGDPVEGSTDSYGEVKYGDLPWGDYTVHLLYRDFDVTFPSAPAMSWSVPHNYPGPNNFPLHGVQQSVRETVRVHRLADGGNGNAYEYVSGGRAWVSAQNQVREAALLGVPGHLVTITNTFENEFVAGFFRDSPNLCLGIPLVNCDFMAWLGLTDAAEETIFLWVTGEALGSLRPWDPDSMGGSEHNEDYVEINALGLWSTVNGASSTNDGYFVEFDVPEIIGPSGT